VIDRVEIAVKAGKGGDGAISFRREKFVPYGGPDGGDGGEGGSVVVKADPAVTDLRKFGTKRLYRAGNGEAGRGKKKHGRRGEDVILSVPIGTVVSQKDQLGGDIIIADLDEPGRRAVVRGGKGGLGNIHFSSSTNQVPRMAQQGEAGEEGSVLLELRLIADAGIIGYPNVGKSTLLAAASAARPKIAGYPFTTLEPALGAVEVGRQSFVLAEIPGLVADAHLGRGLGHGFLRHIMRTRLLVHLVDGSAESPLDDMIRVNNELSLFDSALARKPQLVAVNKIDLPQVRARRVGIRDDFRRAGVKVLFVSAETGEGVDRLMAAVAKMLAQLSMEKETGERLPRKVFRPQPRDGGAGVHREGDTFVIEAPGMGRLVTEGGIVSPEVRGELKKRLTRLGIGRTLEKAGIKPGDKVRCGSLEWEW